MAGDIAGVHRKDADADPLPVLGQGREGVRLRARQTRAAQTWRHFLGGEQQFAALKAETQRKDALVLGDTVQERDQRRLRGSRDVDRDLIADRTKHQTRAQFCIALLPPGNHVRR